MFMCLRSVAVYSPNSLLGPHVILTLQGDSTVKYSDTKYVYSPRSPSSMDGEGAQSQHSAAMAAVCVRVFQFVAFSLYFPVIFSFAQLICLFL